MNEQQPALICLRCGHANPAAMRVCALCAGELGYACPRCGRINPVGFNYCGHCGFSLQGLPSPAPYPCAGHGERRDVTVLFADLTDVGGRIYKLDTEEVYSIAGGCSRLLAEQVQRRGGTVDKFTMGGIMALFGMPVAHGDDAERAVYCALEIQHALTELNRELRVQHGVNLKVRIGINIGTVIVGPVGTHDKGSYTVVGDSVNLAARLQQAALPDQILVSVSVYQRTRSQIVYRSVGPLNLKGLPTAVPAYQAVGLRQTSRPGDLLPRLHARRVGRATS